MVSNRNRHSEPISPPYVPWSAYGLSLRVVGRAAWAAYRFDLTRWCVRRVVRLMTA